MLGLKNRRMPFNRVFAMGLAMAMSIIGVSLFAGSERVHACGCVGIASPSETLSEATAVFAGMPVDISVIRWRESLMGGEVRRGVDSYEFRVSVVWKGEVYETMFVNTSNGNGSSCDYGFVLDMEYVVYAYDVNGTLWAGQCTRTAPVRLAQEDLDELGEGAAPMLGSNASPLMTVPTVANGSCNVFAPHSQVPIDAWPLTLVAGVAWFGFRRRKK